MPIEGLAGTLDIENATLRSNAIAVLTNLVTGNDGVRESGAPALEVYGDPGPRLELVSNTAATDGTATFTRLESNVGVFSIQSGADAVTNGPITFGGFSNERMRIDADGNVGIGTDDPLSELDLYNPVGTELIVSRNAGSSVNPSIRLWNFDDNNYNNHSTGSAVGTIHFSGNERLTGETHTDNSRAFSYANTLYDWARISALYVGSSDSATTSQGYVRGDLAFYTNNGDGATSDLQERMRIKHNGNVGIGTTIPQDLTHIRRSGGNGVDGLLIEQNNSGTGSAALRFGVANTSEPNNMGVPKAGILFRRNATNGRGDLFFCIDNIDDANGVGVADAALKITGAGYIQPGQINTGYSGSAGSLKGNYLFQAIYNVYRVNGYANTSWSGVFEKRAQVCRMGSLVSIEAYLPIKLTSTTMDLQFTWAELGLEGERNGVRTVMNQSSGGGGTWGNATGNSTYLTLPSTGHIGNGSVVYVNIRYLLLVSRIIAY